MSTIHLQRTTTATPEQYVAGLTDFGPGRSNLFVNSADAYLKVHHRGRSNADVTEGSGGIWERLYYDWSDPRGSAAGSVPKARSIFPPERGSIRTSLSLFVIGRPDPCPYGPLAGNEDQSRRPLGRIRSALLTVTGVRSRSIISGKAS